MKKFNRIVLDPFCQRQFNKNSSSFIDYDMKQFQSKANELYQDSQLHDGYAPFCKHIFIQNFAKVQKSHLIKSCYQSRTQKQLPVLRRYFPKQSLPQIAPSKYLDIILYTKQQIQKQNQSMGNIDPNRKIDYDFGIISVKPQDVMYETPMDPITMMRNALGKQHGGSGVQLNREKYMQSVKYWENNAIVK